MQTPSQNPDFAGTPDIKDVPGKVSVPAPPSAQEPRHPLANGLKFRSPRHPGTEHFGPHFAFGHLPVHLQEVSSRFARLAQFLVDTMHDGPELTVALRKLWEAKNSAVLHSGFIAGKQKASQG